MRNYTSDTGEAFVFVKESSGWSQQAKLIDPYAGSYDHFAAAVGLQGDTAVLGEPGGGYPAYAGLARVFRRNLGVWTLERTIVRTTSDGYDFGGELSLSGNQVTVAGSEGVSVYSILPDDPVRLGDISGGYGISVSSNGSHFVAGINAEATSLPNEAYVYRLDGRPLGCSQCGCECIDIALPANCAIDLSDLAAILSSYGQATSLGDAPPFDGIVDLADLSYLLGRYGLDCN